MKPTNPLYHRVCEELIDEAHLAPPLRAILEDKIQEVAKAPLQSAISYTQSDRLLADQVVQKMGIDSEHPDFQVVLIACHDFNLAIALTKQREHQFFHVNPAPPPELRPVLGQPITTRHTLLQHAARSGDDLEVIAKVFGIKNIRDLVLVKPERLAMHYICQEVVTHYGLEAQGDVDDVIAKVIPLVCEEFIEKKPSFTEEVESCRQEMEAAALKYLEARERGESYPFEYADLVEELTKQAEKTEKKRQGLTPAQIKQAIAQRTADLLTKQFVRQMVKQFFQAHSPQALEPFPRLRFHDDKTRRSFMINGGIASGKGTTKSICIEKAKKEGALWSDVMVLSADSLKPLLLRKEDLREEEKQAFSSLTQDEKSVIRDLILEEYQSQVAEGNAPHFFWDQTKPASLMFEMAGSPEGMGLDLFIVQLPPESSFRLAYSRGEKTGRFETASAILVTHSEVPLTLLSSLEEAEKRGMLNIRLNIVANRSPGVVTPIVEMDFEKKVGVIHNLDRLLEFFKKAHLNTKAETFEEMYPHEIPREVLMRQVGALAAYLPEGLTVLNQEGHIVGKITGDGLFHQIP